MLHHMKDKTLHRNAITSDLCVTLKASNSREDGTTATIHCPRGWCCTRAQGLEPRGLFRGIQKVPSSFLAATVIDVKRLDESSLPNSVSLPDIVPEILSLQSAWPLVGSSA